MRHSECRFSRSVAGEKAAVGLPQSEGTAARFGMVPQEPLGVRHSQCRFEKAAVGLPQSKGTAPRFGVVPQEPLGVRHVECRLEKAAVGLPHSEGTVAWSTAVAVIGVPVAWKDTGVLLGQYRPR